MKKVGQTEVRLTKPEAEVVKTHRELVESGMSHLDAIHHIENLLRVDDPEFEALQNAEFRDWLIS